MTSRCERPPGARPLAASALWLSLLLSLGAFCTPRAQAQDGTRLPPPPPLKRRHLDAPDPDFKSPLKKETDQEQQFQNEAGPLRRRRLRNPGAAGVGPKDGQFNAGQGFGNLQRFNGQFGGGQGFGAGQRPGALFGAQGFQGEGAQRFGAQGFGQLGKRRAAGQGQRLGIFGASRALDLRPLNLSDEQKQHIRQIRTATREQLKDARGTMQERQRELRSMMFNPNASDADIRATRKQLRQAQDRIDDLNLNDWLKVRSTLTAEQRQHLPEIAPNPGGQRGAAANNPAVSQRQ